MYSGNDKREIDPIAEKIIEKGILALDYKKPKRSRVKLRERDIELLEYYLPNMNKEDRKRALHTIYLHRIEIAELSK